MQLPSWNIHVFHSARGIQLFQLPRKPRSVVRLDSRFRTGFEKPPQTGVAKALDHGSSVSPIDTHCKSSEMTLLVIRDLSGLVARDLSGFMFIMDLSRGKDR